MNVATQNDTADRSLLVEVRGAAGIVTLNRPAAINAVNDAIRIALPEVLKGLDADPRVAAIVLCGAGDRGFCAGADIKESRGNATGVGARKRLMPASWIEALDQVAKRSEEHTSELQSLMRNSYAVFCLKKKKKT